MPGVEIKKKQPLDPWRIITMKLLIYGISLTLMASLLIGSSTGGFVNDPTIWNDPNFTGLNDTYICPFGCYEPFSLDDYLNPRPPVGPTVVEPEKPIPIVLPAPLPYTKGDIASLLDSLSTKKVPSQTFGKLNTIFF
jgi:hypothetical protein